ncbi:hypothetical protein [Haloarchaeobius sp. TZWSO28]|uniref:hypothetical protein n=1 Tax=Haloarchaeobius sp. TZWSO28 TaxID=3446119 RepID=UPI003EB89B2C
MTLERFDLSALVPAAESPENVTTSERYGPPADDEEPPQTLRCAVCGVPEDRARDLPVGYANPVCRDCDELAVDQAGDDPWTGWPPGERPEPEAGAIQLAPDAGANPVYIAGVKCWRRYRFGGHITRRDAFDCDSLDDFSERHRVEPVWIHAFNTPQPGGVDVGHENRDVYESLVDEWGELWEVAWSVAMDKRDAPALTQRIEESSDRVQAEVPDRGDSTIEDYARSVHRIAEQQRDHYQARLDLCDRYDDRT